MAIKLTGLGGMDYSTLFSSLSTSNKSNISSFMGSYSLADYASIKNGSYSKVLKAYYRKNAASDSSKSASDQKSSSTRKDSSSTLARVESSADALKSSADALEKSGSKSVFNKKEITTKNEDGTTTTVTDYDRDAIYKSVKSFTDHYNSLVKAGGNANSTNILRQTLNVVKYTASNKNKLAAAGISINDDNTLSVDKDALQKADIEALTSLFKGANSYGSTVSSRASSIASVAKNESRKANTYTAFGTYSSIDSASGNILNDYF